MDFGYNDDTMVLHDVSLYAQPGQKIAFVGSTGAGKTTITNLINRFYDIQSGKIRYDGINIGKIKKDDLRHSLGIVLQDKMCIRDRAEKLVSCPCYTVCKATVNGTAEFDWNQPFVDISVLDGEGSFDGTPVKKGTHLIVPAGYGKMKAEGKNLMMIYSYKSRAGKPTVLTVG